jgi:hypothetical protein
LASRSPDAPPGKRRSRWTPEEDAPPPHSPSHDDWLLDEALVETFPASDPISPSPPKSPDGAGSSS